MLWPSEKKSPERVAMCSLYTSPAQQAGCGGGGRGQRGGGEDGEREGGMGGGTEGGAARRRRGRGCGSEGGSEICTPVYWRTRQGERVSDGEGRACCKRL